MVGYGNNEFRSEYDEFPENKDFLASHSDSSNGSLSLELEAGFDRFGDVTSR